MEGADDYLCTPWSRSDIITEVGSAEHFERTLNIALSQPKIKDDGSLFAILFSLSPVLDKKSEDNWKLVRDQVQDWRSIKDKQGILQHLLNGSISQDPVHPKAAEELFKLVISLGVDPDRMNNAQEKTRASHLVAINAKEDLMKLLLDCRTDTTATDDNNRTLLQLAKDISVIYFSIYFTFNISVSNKIILFTVLATE
jgi:hypothetical protein